MGLGASVSGSGCFPLLFAMLAGRSGHGLARLGRVRSSIRSASYDGPVTIHENQATTVTSGALRNTVDSELRPEHVRRLITPERMDLADERIRRDPWR